LVDFVLILTTKIHPCHSKNCLKSDQRLTEVTLAFSDFYWDRP